MQKPSLMELENTKKNIRAEKEDVVKVSSQEMPYMKQQET